MAIKGRRVTVGTAPTQINGATTDAIGGSGGQARNRGTVSVFLGGVDVTVAQGYELEPGDVVAFNLDHGENIYGIVASGTCLVHVLDGGV